MLDQVKCPHCGKLVEISQALKHELLEKAIDSEKEKHKKELEEVRLGVTKRIEDKLKDQFELQIATAKEDLIEKEKRNRELLDQLTELSKTVRDLKTKYDERRLEMERKLTEVEEKIRLDAKKRADEESHLKLLEKEKQLADAIKVNEELKRKLQQGSMQTQGEVMELELEEILAKEFPNDKITPVGKGIRGADIIHEVWDRNGNRSGTILWESKNAKWNSEWIGKLKDDQRRIKADIAVLVSENLPDGVKSASFRDGIWLAQRAFFIGIAMALRHNIIQASYIRKSVQGKNDKMEKIYNYIYSVEFTHRIDAIIESYSQLQDELEKEQRYFAGKWARQTKHIRSVLDNTIGMHGDLKGLAGTSFPEIKSLKEGDIFDQDKKP